MGVYIKGFEFPKACWFCDFCRAYNEPNHGYFCCALEADLDKTTEIIQTQRDKNCPLVPVPPHGRLIDERWLKDATATTLEALIKNPKMDAQEMHIIAAFDTLREMIDDAPTIIESEEPLWKRMVAAAEEYGKHIPEEVMQKVEKVICETVCIDKEDKDG